jgi:hypothetical protein
MDLANLKPPGLQAPLAPDLDDALAGREIWGGYARLRDHRREAERSEQDTEAGRACGAPAPAGLLEAASAAGHARNDSGFVWPLSWLAVIGRALCNCVIK